MNLAGGGAGFLGRGFNGFNCWRGCGGPGLNLGLDPRQHGFADDGEQREQAQNTDGHAAAGQADGQADGQASGKHEEADDARD